MNTAIDSYTPGEVIKMLEASTKSVSSLADSFNEFLRNISKAPTIGDIKHAHNLVQEMYNELNFQDLLCKEPRDFSRVRNCT